MKHLIDLLIRKITGRPDPLDEMLIEKGVDPEILMAQHKMRQEEEGDSNAFNRSMERSEKKRERADRDRASALKNIRRGI